MSNLLAVVLLAVAVMSPARSQQVFTNLDFEQAQVVPNNPFFGFLHWSLAVPGWSHSTGEGTESVYYGLTHVGATQYFLLVDSVSQPHSLLDGSYSFAFASGFENSSIPSRFIHAFISQTGEIPGGARYLRLLATGNFGVLIDGVPVSMEPFGGNAYIGDVSAFSGTTAQLKIVNTSPTFQDPVVVDNIAFLPVPEPATHAFMLAGLAGLALVVRRRRMHFRSPLMRNVRSHGKVLCP